MAKFVKHAPCPKCGSRDNLGVYSDGSAFCFGCHYSVSATTSPWVGERNGNSEECNDELQLRGTTTLDARAVEWLASYGLSIPQVLRWGVRWDDRWEQLLFPLYTEDGSVCCIQAKNFNLQRARKAKYYNTGDKTNHRTAFLCCVSIRNAELKGKSSHSVSLSCTARLRACCLTEDIVSSMKVSSVCDAFPLLGTSITKETLTWLARRYTHLYVWLDDDKWKEGRDIADAAKLLGLSATALLTPLDPKCYDKQTIKEYLNV